MSSTPTFEPPQLDPGHPLDLGKKGSVAVRDLGPKDAPAVMMLHGWTVTADLNWFGQYGPISEHYRVISYDHAGHGAGRRPRGRVSIKSLADDAIAVADALDLERVVVFGYSLGGTVAQVVARDHSHRLDGLVLSATQARFRTDGLPIWPSILAMTATMTRVTPSAIVDRVFMRMLEKRTADLHPWGKEQLEKNDPRILLEVGSSMFNFDATEWLGDIDVPTAVVVTEHDPKILPSRQRQFADFIDGTSMHPVPGAHDAPVTRPEDFNAGLLAAIDSVLGARE